MPFFVAGKFFSSLPYPCSLVSSNIKCMSARLLDGCGGCRCEKSYSHTPTHLVSIWCSYTRKRANSPIKPYSINSSDKFHPSSSSARESWEKKEQKRANKIASCFRLYVCTCTCMQISALYTHQMEKWVCVQNTCTMPKCLPYIICIAVLGARKRVHSCHLAVGVAFSSLSLCALPYLVLKYLRCIETFSLWSSLIFFNILFINIKVMETQSLAYL